MILYGLLVGFHSVPFIVSLLGIKILITPFLLSSVSRIDDGFKQSFFSTLFIIQIINGMAAILENLVGLEKLQVLGLEYGTNVRNFDHFLRVPGLARTNYELGSYSAIVLVIVYLTLTNQMDLESKISKKFCVSTGIASFVCLMLSNFRSGIIFSILTIALCELLSRKNVLGFSLITVCISTTILLAISVNFFLLDSNSSLERFAKWSELLSSYDWRVGSGIGFTGGATRSSFASGTELIVTDNQFVSMLLQYGLFGLMSTFLLLFFFFISGNFVTKSLVISLLTMMIFVEVWDLTLFFTLVLYLMYDGIFIKMKKMHL